MKKHAFIAAPFAAVLITAFAASLLAQPQGPGGRGPHKRPGLAGPMGEAGPGGIGLPFLRELDLTDAQREQVRTITQSHRDEVQQIAVRVGTAQRAMDAAAIGATVDEAAIRARSTELAAALADGAILRAKVNAEIVGVLTPEQQQKLTELRAQMAERMKQRGERRPPRPRG